jgi:hypothetical protein
MCGYDSIHNFLRGISLIDYEKSMGRECEIGRANHLDAIEQNTIGTIEADRKCGIGSGDSENIATAHCGE